MNQLQHHRSQAQAILFYAFDVIIHGGRRLIHVPLETRRELLSDIAADLKTRTPLIGLSDTLDTTPAELIPLVKEFGFEGVIAKRWDSWQTQRRLAQVQGKQSTGIRDWRLHARQPIDALIVGYYEGDKLMFASKVRNGFVPRLRRDVWAKLRGSETATCPFADLQRRTELSGRSPGRK